MYDLLLKNGLIVDGSGQRAYRADLAVKGDRIVEIGSLADREAREIIEAEEKIVCPGFIDIHSHDEIELIRYRSVEPKLRQGVTTVVNGNCGMGLYPINDRTSDLLMDYNGSLYEVDGLDINWKTYGEYAAILEKQGIGINTASLVGHGVLRIAVMGFDERPPEPDEIERMLILLQEAAAEGAFGMSSGLLYPPSSYAGQEEIKAFCNLLAQQGLPYTTHMRNESDGIIDSIKENIQLARETGVSVEISHLNISGKDNWGKAEEILQLIEDAREAGCKLSCDQYPYQAGCTFLTACLPQWTLNMGIKSLIKRLAGNHNNIRERIRRDILEGIPGWDNILRYTGWDKIVINSVSTDKNKGIVGKSIAEIAGEWGLDYFATLFKILIEEQGNTTILIFSVCDEDFVKLFTSDFVMIGTDGIKINGSPHPRLYGSYPRVIADLVRKRGLLPLEEAVKKMTLLPAEKIGLKKRGLLKKGYYADLVIFDYQGIKDLATYSNPEQYPEGIEGVIVNGRIAFNGSDIVNSDCGRVLKSTD